MRAKSSGYLSSLWIPNDEPDDGLPPDLFAEDESMIMDTECPRCAGSGTIGVRCSTLSYVAPGPVPEDARGVAEAKCDRCQGSGVIAVDCETGNDA